MQLTGIHHLTAVTARAAENVAFYTGTLGLRLVKKTVNQDDVSAYHLFYADGLASPGSDITFFDWPAPPERRGSNSITRTHLRVPGDVVHRERVVGRVGEQRPPDGDEFGAARHGTVGPARPGACGVALLTVRQFRPMSGAVGRDSGSMAEPSRPHVRLRSPTRVQGCALRGADPRVRAGRAA